MLVFIEKHYLVIWFLLLFIIEFILYSKQVSDHSYRYNHWVTNVVNYLVTKGAGLLIFLPLITYAAYHPLTHWVSSLGTVLGVLLTIMVLDFAGYWFHRMSHENEFLWRAHEIHHLDEMLDVTTGLRVHVLELFCHTLLDAFLVFILGLPPLGIVIHSALGFIVAIYHHSRIKMSLRLEKIISYFITTPRFHEPHHDHLIENNQTNYSFIFPIWDRMFGTYHKSTFENSWDFGLIYCKDVSAIKSIVRPFRIKKEE